MFLTEQNGTQMWQKMLKENFGVTDNDKLNWVSQLAATHEIFESNLGYNGTVGGGQQAMPGTVGVGPIYATPLNTVGMGNPMMPGTVAGQIPTGYPVDGQNDFRSASIGSGEMPLSTLPMALNVALMTIGLELVPVIPTKGPFQLLSYMDFPYAGGKVNAANNLTKLDGFGEGRENKPLYVKFLGVNSTFGMEKVEDFATAKNTFKENDAVVVTGNGVTFNGYFKAFGRMDGGLILEVKDCKKGDVDVAITDLFAGNGEVTCGELTLTKVDYAQTMVDFIDGFANFATGKKQTMTRAENETGTGNTLGLRLFSKWIQVGSYEVTGTVTRQQLQDLPLYGVDAVGKVMEAMQNELTQHINARILDKVWGLGVTNAVKLRSMNGVDLNLYMDPGTDATMADSTISHFTDINGVDWKEKWGPLTNAEVNTSAENLSTRQRRIMSRILAAVNLVQVTGRRGRATWVVTNAKIATALQDCSGYVVAPMANTLTQDGSQSLYLAGTVAGLKIYVDPYMDWEDTRVLVGRKGTANEPGVVFMPYILADQVSITAEGTMAPKMLVNSRFAIAEIGFFPESQFFAFMVYCPNFNII